MIDATFLKEAEREACEMTETINPPLKWHGGKQYLARRIIALFPPHIHYVEPFFGGGAVMMEKDPEQRRR